MECPNCGRSNPGDAAFCGACGSALQTAGACPGCGRRSPPGNDFCPGCGAPLRAPERGAEAGTSGERRHLTVMFTDLADSTRLAGELDPEDMRDLVMAYQDACAAAITGHGGYLAHYMGDGVMAYFGFPTAHEDDARRAVAAGLEVVRAAAELRARFDREDIWIRVGMHSGEVVVAGMSAPGRRQVHDVVGETPNVAARLQAGAGPDTVVVSASTRELVQGWFTLVDLGELRLKGVARPVGASSVVSATEARTRIEALAPRGLTPLVGRSAEMAQLLACWDEVRAGAGRAVLVSGEPGIGKSRLAHELNRRAADAGAATIALRCSPYNTSSALFPVVEHLLRVVGEGDPAARGARLEQELAPAGPLATEAAPLIGELLGISTDAAAAITSDSAERRKRRTLDALFGWLRSKAGPLLIVVEDAHWMDPTTLELVGRWFSDEPVEGVMLLLTHRPDFVPPWPHHPHVIRLALERLGSSDVLEIVGLLTGGRALPSNVTSQISTRTDGVPLFVEEVTQAVLESGAVAEHEGRLVATASMPERLVPSTLRESLMARLDRLGPAREVAQVLSVVGREASTDLLRAVSLLDYDELEAGLERLVGSDLVRRRDVSAQPTYRFKHWLVQDVAYESLLRSRRRRYHERIAAALPLELPEVAQTQPEFIAHHLIAAGRESEAIVFLHRAGELAHRRSANVEAIEHLTRALTLVRRRPESAERDEQELTILMALGAPLTASRGYSAPEVEENYARAGQLCRSLGSSDPQLFGALYGTWRVHLLRADYKNAFGFAQRLMGLAVDSARGSRDGTREAAAHRALGSTLFYLGDDPATARSHLEQVIASQSLERTRTSFIDELHDVVDPWITCHAYQAWSLWLMGRPEPAWAMSDQALRLADELGHPFTRALTLSFDSWLRQFSGDLEGTRRRATEALAISTDQGFGFWIGWAELMRGWATAAAGEPDAGLAEMEHGLRAWRAVGSGLGISYFLFLMAEAQAGAGRLDDALRSLDSAEAIAERTGEGWWAPELRRARGELLWAAGAPPEEVERHMLDGLELAHRRPAPALSLRSAMSLARLWREQARDDDARLVLTTELGPFDDGHRDAGVRRARELLAKLA